MSDGGEVVKRNYKRFTSTLETRLIYERIKQMEVGDILTYEEMTEIISQDVQKDGRPTLNSARYIAQRENQIVTDPVRNVGIKRLSDREIVASGSATMDRIRRTTDRGIRRMLNVNFNDLEYDNDKRMHNANISAWGVMKMMTRPKTMDRLMGAVNTSNTGQLPVQRTLEFFRNLNNNPKEL